MTTRPDASAPENAPGHGHSNTPSSTTVSPTRSFSAKIRRVVFVIALCGIVISVVGCIHMWNALGTTSVGERQARLQASPQWDQTRGKFTNPLPRVDDMSLSMLGDYWSDNEVREPTAPLPIVVRDKDSLVDGAHPLRVTWLGHSTLLVEIDGKRVLIDPVWGERASPSSVIGPGRFHPPPAALNDVLPVDAILISHDHYDHLDAPTIEALVGENVRFFVPLGIGAHLAYWGIENDRIVELDWWDEAHIDDVTLASVPARHFSGRTGLDEGHTLWTGWVMKGPVHRAFYSGDTAMHPTFAAIGEKYGPFDVTMIESGAYNQRWADVHLGPEQAVDAHKMVNGGVLIPVHWGTFNLAIHTWTEPPERIIVAAKKLDVPIAVPRPGESVIPSEIVTREGSVLTGVTFSSSKYEKWWPELPWKTAEQAPVISSHLDVK